MQLEKYQFRKALRPFSFSVALVVCLTGIVAAYADGYSNHLLASLIVIAGLLLQAGVNLINDYSDLYLLVGEQYIEVRGLIRRNFQYGLICFLLAAVLGIYLIYSSGLLLLLFAVIGILGALGYTLEPINYKRRGLAVFLVFWLMGVLMVSGAYYALSAQVTTDILLISIPVSLYTSLLLLSNELRDFEDDSANGIKTLTVRIGFKNALLIYYVCLVAIFGIALLFSFTGLIPQAWLVLLGLPVALLALRHLHKPATQRTQLTPATGRSFMIFGLLYCLAINTVL